MVNIHALWTCEYLWVRDLYFHERIRESYDNWARCEEIWAMWCALSIKSIWVMISLSYGMESEVQRLELFYVHFEYVGLMTKRWVWYVGLNSSMWNSMAYDIWCCALYVEYNILWYELWILIITMEYLWTMW